MGRGYTPRRGGANAVRPASIGQQSKFYYINGMLERQGLSSVIFTKCWMGPSNICTFVYYYGSAGAICCAAPPNDFGGAAHTAVCSVYFMPFS